MTEAAERLKTELAQLPPTDRAELAHFLLHTLDDESEGDVDAAWEAELQRRWAEVQSGQAVEKPADQVLDRLRQKYS
jgi:putative addiction module component (TIGR02574 family)